ncbi:MAG: type II secretion system protein [Thermoleophilia bacterium]
MSSRQPGFSLVEVTVAAVILLLTCTAVTLTITQAQRAEARLAGHERLVALLAAEQQRLTALPYFVSPVGSGPQPVPGAEPSCLVAAVFPHAVTTLNGESAYYTADASQGPPGAFVTRARIGEVVLVCTARFVRADPGGYVPLPPERLAGWTAWGTAAPPAACLSIRLAATDGRREVTAELLLGALRLEVEPSPGAGTGGSGGA